MTNVTLPYVLQLARKGFEELGDDLLGGGDEQPLPNTRHHAADLGIAGVLEQCPGALGDQGQGALPAQEAARPLPFNFHAEMLGRDCVEDLNAPSIGAFDGRDPDAHLGRKTAIRIWLELFAPGQGAGEDLGIE